MTEMAAPEIRIDQLTGLRTILAPGRAARPDAFSPVAAESRPDAAETCPFCEGREDRTPPEVWADRPGNVSDGPDGRGAPDTPGWQTRSVPNMYPALVSGGDAANEPLAATGRDEADMFVPRPAVGAHEVIISSPRHVTSLADLDEAGLRAAIDAWAVRMAFHETGGSGSPAAYVHLIVNEGPLAGASLEHSHAQLYALGFVPAAVARERERAASYHQRTMGGLLLSDVLTEEVRRRDRLVAIDDTAAVFCPWASRSPFEIRIVPRRAQASFAETGADVAPMLAAALRALKGALGTMPQLNLWIRNAPRDARSAEAGFLWHIDIRPRLGVQAGLELGAGVDLCSYAPETAAANLRSALD